jgi:hypothetical protein
LNELENAYDQSLLITPAEFELFSDVDTVVASSLIQADPRPALEFGRRLRRDGQLKGLALAKLLSCLDKNWAMFQTTGMEERIEDIVFVEMGISPQTTRKYIRLWEDLFENPMIAQDIKNKLFGKSIKSLLLLTAAARDGDDIDWSRIANAENGAEIRELVRDARGPTTSSEASVLLMMDREGILYAKRGSDGDRLMVGRLLIGEMDNQIIEKAINRIVERGGVIWL